MEQQNSIPLTEYCSWLSKQYGLDLPWLSFRDAVGRYIRAYGKGNCDEKHPLHYVATEPGNKTIIALLKLFDRYSIISEIEAFHKKVSTIFKQELNAERKTLLAAIAEFDSIIQGYEAQLKELIQNPQLSKIVLQRHAEALKSIEKMRRDNDAYVKSEELKRQKKQDEERLSNIKSEQLGIIENLLNNEMKRINDLLYKEEYNAPLIHFSDSGYFFTTPNDTGTGIAYKGLVVLDLAMLHLTRLPIVVHCLPSIKNYFSNSLEIQIYL